MPDIIHLHGWFASLFPFYFKNFFSDDPVFDNSKIVSSIYNKSFEGSLSKKTIEKIQFDGRRDIKLYIIIQALSR